MQPLTGVSGDATIPFVPLRPQFLPPPASALFPSSPRTPQPSTVRSLQSAGRKEPPAQLPSWFSRRALPSPPDTPLPTQAGGIAWACDHRRACPSSGLLGSSSTAIRVSLRNEHTSVSYTHLRAHETDSYLVCRLLL